MIKTIFKNIKKPFIVGDLHFCEFSSILRRKGLRLKNLIDTINWAIGAALEMGCDSIIFLGDFFDKPELNAEELTALSGIHWPESLTYYCIVGNHELGKGDASCSSTHILKQIKNFKVIDEVTAMCGDKCDYVFFPYIVDNSNRKLDLYLEKDMYKDKPLIILSHNDIKGIQMGSFLSKEGFDIEDIKNKCTLFINGHLHNGQWVDKNILNIGNITGQNFSEDARVYGHNAVVLDFESNNIPVATQLCNPFAFNFYKIDLTAPECKEYNLFDNLILFPHSVLSIRCYQKDITKVRDFFSTAPNIEEFRIISVPEPTETNVSKIEDLVEVDHIEKFKQYVLDILGPSEQLIKELQEISL